MSKRVAIINGVARMKKYNKRLAERYRAIGYEATEYQFNPLILFSCHAHPLLDSKIQSILEKSDVVHCQSSGFFRVLPYMSSRGLLSSTPLILESPVLKSHSGTLLAALNVHPSYNAKPQNPAINLGLDLFCFTPAYKEATLSLIAKHGGFHRHGDATPKEEESRSKEGRSGAVAAAASHSRVPEKNKNKRNKILTLHSTADNVSDVEGLEHLFHHTFDTGKHARLFHDDGGDGDGRFECTIEAFLGDFEKSK